MICPHGHIEARIFANENYSFGTPTELFITLDHYIFRMLYSQGVILESLGIKPLDATIDEQDSDSETDKSHRRENSHRHVWQHSPDVQTRTRDRDRRRSDFVRTAHHGNLLHAREMLKRGYGRIINIASLSTFVVLKEVAAHAASKAAVGSLTKSLAIEWARSGVNVNAIAPGVFRTASNQHLLDESERGREFNFARRCAASGKLKNSLERQFIWRPMRHRL